MFEILENELLHQSDIKTAISKEFECWEHKIKRLWSYDQTLWTNCHEHKLLGWLNIPFHQQHEIKELIEDLKINFTDVVLIGMGGSILAPLMYKEIFEKPPGYPNLYILDSTHPEQIKNLEQKINLQSTCFIISSKSGKTLESNILKNYFYKKINDLFNSGGRQFIAITDKDSPLDLDATTYKFKKILYGEKTIGGRYSALTIFGMLPLALRGININAFLQNAATMQKLCSPNNITIKKNPGVGLGIILGVAAKFNHDKLTLILSPGLKNLGAWIEQLIAESLGKNNQGLITIDLESLGKPDVYQKDRLFLLIQLSGENDLEQTLAINALKTAGFSVIKNVITNKMHLGAELFKWQLATSVAGSILSINPFNQPDVEDSKEKTISLLTQKNSSLLYIKPLFQDDKFLFFSNITPDLTDLIYKQHNFINYLIDYLALAQNNSYVDITAFISTTTQNIEILQKLRTLIRDTFKVATCLNFAPRYLHSVGQNHKGGKNNGIFIQITADIAKDKDLLLADSLCSFGDVLQMQGKADFITLTKRQRKVMRIHLVGNVLTRLQELYTQFKLEIL